MIRGLAMSLAMGAAWGAPPATVHPLYDLKVVPLPELYRTMGIGFLGDGRMILAVTDFKGGGEVPAPRAGSKVLAVSGLDGDMKNVRVKEIANNFRQPSGLTVADGKIYVADRDAFYHILDPDFTGDLAQNRKLVVKWPDEGNWKYGFAWHHWVFTPVHWKGLFFAPNSGSIVPGGPSDVGPATRMDGAFLQWDTAGKMEAFAGGLRSPNGAGINAAGEMFVTDNQGSWLPGSTFMQMKPGRFYGHRQSPPAEPNWAESLPYQPPVAWLPEPEVRNSPTEPAVIPAGPYAGDWIMGDNNNYGLIRIALDKVKGEYQGGVFWFSQGFSDLKFCSGTQGAPAINRLAFGLDGGLYIGTFEKVVGTPAWSGCGPAPFFKLSPRAGGEVFEMRAIRSMQDGFEIEFTEQVDPGTISAGRFTVKQEKYTRNPQYGIGRGGYKPRSVTKAELSADRKRVHLVVRDLTFLDVVTSFNLDSIRSTRGAELWSKEAWYTLNAISERSWDPVSTPKPPASPSGLETLIKIRTVVPGTLEIGVELEGHYRLDLRSLDGRLIARRAGWGPGIQHFTADDRGGARLLQVVSGSRVGSTLILY